MTFQRLDILAPVICFASIAIAGIWYVSWYRRRTLRKAFGPRYADAAIIDFSRSGRMFRTVLLVLAVIFSVIALVGPTWGEKLREVHNEGSDVMILLDVSRSMIASDAEPSRLERAKNAIRFLVSGMKGDRAGLILFAGSSFIQCPLTSDMSAFSQFLDAASTGSIADQGTDIGSALEIAAKVFEKKRITSKVLFLITDGEDHEGKIDQAVAHLKKLEVTVYTAGVGRDGGAVISQNGEVLLDNEGHTVHTKIDEKTLKSISSETGGEFFDITDSFSGVSRIQKAMGESGQTDFGVKFVKEPQARYYIPALIVFLLLGAEPFVTERKRA